MWWCRWSAGRSGSPDTRADPFGAGHRRRAPVTLRRFLLVAPALGLTLGLAACGGSSSGGNNPATTSPAASAAASGSLTVGAAGFTESNVLAQMYADLLQKAGFSVSIKTVSSQEIFQSSL